MNENEKLLREKFYEGIAGQSDLVDKLGERLLTLELAIPGLYAAVLKLVRGDKATVLVNPAFYITFGCWLLALVLTLVALTPRKWIVDTNILKQDPNRFSEGLGLEDFFAMVLVWRNRPQPEGEGPPATRTLTGTFKWNGAQDRQHRVTVVLTPAGGSNWIAHYTAYWDRSTISYHGILTGDLENGEVTGTAASVDGKRTWQLTGKAGSGVIEAQHWEITPGNPQLTGTLTLKR